MRERLRAILLALALGAFLLNMFVPSLPPVISALSLIIVLAAVVMMYEWRRSLRGRPAETPKYLQRPPPSAGRPW